MRQIIGFAIAAVLLGGVACRRSAESPKKIPITTSSAEARAAFLKGRDLLDKLRLAEAQPLLDEAISKDPNLPWRICYARKPRRPPRSFSPT